MTKVKHIGASPLTGKIYQGTLDTEKSCWVGQKRDITVEACRSVAEHFAEQQPLCMTKRVEELEAKVRVMAGLLREATEWMDEHPAMPDSSRMHEALSVRMPSPSAPEGWQLVPVKLTQEMADAAKWIDGRLSVWKWADGYKAMLAAAPNPEAK